MFSIVIVNWNGEKLLGECLESIDRSTYREFKVYLVDNGSQDKSVAIANSYKDKFDIEVIELDKNYGFAYANNVAIDKAMNDKNKYILTLNNDIEVPQNTLGVLNEYIGNNQDIDIFQLMMINYYERNKIDAAGLIFDKDYFVMPLGYNESVEKIKELKCEIEGACAGAAVYSKKALKVVKENEIDYFSSDFFAYFEDVDLALRLNKNGFKTNLVKEGIVYHMHSATGNKSSSFKDYYLTRNLFKYFKRNLSEKDYRKSARKGYSIMGKMALKYFAKGNFSSGNAIVRGFIDYKINK